MLKERTDTYKDNKEEIQLHLKTLDDSLQEIRDMHLENTQKINERLVVLETKSTLLMEQQTAFAQDQHHEIHKTLSETGFATGKLFSLKQGYRYHTLGKTYSKFYC